MQSQEFNPGYFTVENRSPIVIATVTLSRLCEEDNIEQFGVELNQIIEGSGSTLLVLDMQSVSMISSSAIGKLIGLHRNLHRREGRLVLCGVNGMIKSVLQAAKLMDYFRVTGDAEAAVELMKLEMARASVLTATQTK